MLFGLKGKSRYSRIPPKKGLKPQLQEALPNYIDWLIPARQKSLRSWSEKLNLSAYKIAFLVCCWSLKTLGFTWIVVLVPGFFIWSMHYQLSPPCYPYFTISLLLLFVYFCFLFNFSLFLLFFYYLFILYLIFVYFCYFSIIHLFFLYFFIIYHSIYLFINLSFFTSMWQSISMPIYISITNCICQSINQ